MLASSLARVERAAYFAFAMLMHPRNPDCAYIVWVESDEFRCVCDGGLRVYRTRDSGASWKALTSGLPQNRAYETVLRDAMTADSFDPAGIYFGTRSGQLFGSYEEGATWRKILDGLPAVVCVPTAVVGGGSGRLAPSRPKAVPSDSSRRTYLSQQRDRIVPRGEAMQVTVHIPNALREFTGRLGKVEVEHSPATVATR
jgi:hypothetical protein